MSIDECRVRVGRSCLSVVSQDLVFLDQFRHFYRRSTVECAPDFQVSVHVRRHLEHSQILKSLAAYRKAGGHLNDGYFRLYDGLIAGRVDLRNRCCEIDVELALLASEYLSLFQDLLFKDLAYHMAKGKYGYHGEAAFMMHGCGIVRAGKGVLFGGPSGCGKSTVARLSQDDAVLHDEAILLSRHKAGYFIETTPYVSEINNLANSRAQLKAVFFLAHGDRNTVVRVPGPAGAARAMRLIAPPLSTGSASSRQMNEEMLGFCCAAAEAVPFFNLNFSNRDGSFWERIDAAC